MPVFSGIAQLTDGDWNGDPNNYFPQNPDLDDSFTVDLPNAANGWTGTLSLAIVGDLNSNDETLTVEITDQATAILFDGNAGNNGLFPAAVQASLFGAQANQGNVKIDGEQGGSGTPFTQATIDKMGLDDGTLANFTFDGSPNTVSTGVFDLTDSTDIKFTISPETAGGGRGVDFAQIEWTLTAEANTLTFDKAISNFVAYLDCNDDGCADTKVKLDEWSFLEDLETPIEVKELDISDVESWLDDEGFDCDLVGLTVKAGNNRDPDNTFTKGEGTLVYGDYDDLTCEVATLPTDNVPEENTFDMTQQIYEEYFVA